MPLSLQNTKISNWKYYGNFTYAFPDVDSCSCFETGFQCRTTDCRSIAHFLKPRCGPHRFVEIQTEVYMKLYLKMISYPENNYKYIRIH